MGNNHTRVNDHNNEQIENAETGAQTIEDAAHPDNKPLKHDGWSDIREKKRHCTDCLCFLLIIASWIALTIIGFCTTGILESNTIPSGNPIRLTNAIDFNGNICGYSKSVKSKHYGYYLPSGLNVACVQKCPIQTNISTFICINEPISNLANSNLTLAIQYTIDGVCMYQLKTKTFLNRCIPDTNTDSAADSFALASTQSSNNSASSIKIVYKFGLSKSNWFYKFAMDIYNLRAYVFGFGIGVATGKYIYILYC